MDWTWRICWSGLGFAGVDCLLKKASKNPNLFHPLGKHDQFFGYARPPLLRSGSAAESRLRPCEHEPNVCQREMPALDVR